MFEGKKKILLIIGLVLAYSVILIVIEIDRQSIRKEMQKIATSSGESFTKDLANTGDDVRGKNLTHAVPSPEYYDNASYKQEDIRRTYYESGELKTESPYENDKKEGMARVYYKNGKLKQEDPYKNDKLEGMARAYYESGGLKAEATYKNGKYEGMARVYYKNGNLWKERPYENGKLEGMEKVYSESGRLWGRIVYSNNKAMSGTCGNGRAFTDAELINWGNGRPVSCD